jgi:hypothetical protein
MGSARCQNALHDLVVLLLGRIEPSDLNPAPLLAAIAAAVAASLVGWRLLRRGPNLRRYDPDEYGEEWNRLRGLLLLLGLLVALEPLRMAFGVACNRVVYTREAWTLLTAEGSPISSGWGPALVYTEAVAPVIQLVFSAIVAIAFLRRKRSMRILAIVYLAMNVVVLALVEVIRVQIFGDYREVINEVQRRMSTAVAAALPLAAYLLASRRVHATFRN